MSDKPYAPKTTWEETTLKKTLDRFPERQERFETTSGSDFSRLLVPQDVGMEMDDYQDRLGFPGEFPFTRGVQPTMYRSRFWTMRQYAGFATAKETNERYKVLLSRGQTGLSVAFDLPTQMGYSADDPMARGEVGKVGVSICSLRDMEQLFDGIPLDKVSTSMTINSTAAILLAMYVAVAEKQGVKSDALTGTIQNDLLKEYIARGTYIFPPEPSMRIITNLFAFCNERVPKWNTISISGYHIREAGSTAVQEVAFTLANAMAYVQSAIDSGMDVDSFAGRLSFFFASHNNLLEEVAKFRAARRLYAKLMKERFGAKKPDSMKLRFHTQTCGHTLTAQQPENNVVRVAIQALAAVLGGTQSLHTNSLDEALALPTERSVTIALRTQQILAHESGVADSIDPLAGSFLVENLTDEIETKALEYIKKIDEFGGAVRAIEEGFQQKEIGDAAYMEQKRIEKGERVIVGLNKFQGKAEPVPLQRVTGEVEKMQVERLQELYKNRDNAAVKADLTRLQDAARDTNLNVVPVILEAVRDFATVGEVANALREVFGTYHDPAKF